MAVYVVDLLQPDGDVDPSLFPSDTEAALTARITAYIVDGDTRAAALPEAERDPAVRAWAYHRAYQAAYVRLNAEAASVTFAGDASSTRLVAQIQNIGQMAQRYLAEFDALTQVAPVVSTPATPQTAFRTVGFSW